MFPKLFLFHVENDDFYQRILVYLASNKTLGASVVAEVFARIAACRVPHLQDDLPFQSVLRVLALKGMEDYEDGGL